MSVCDTVEAQELMQAAFPKRRYGSVKGAHNAAYDYLKPFADLAGRELKFRRIRQLWEGKAYRVDGWEKDALRRAQIEEAQSEQRELRQRLSKLDEMLAAIDARQARVMGESA